MSSLGQPRPSPMTNSDHIPWLADRRASIEWKFTKRYQRFLKERKGLGATDTSAFG